MFGRKRTAEQRRETLIVVGLVASWAWREIQRRLTTLNHAHEQAVEVQHTYVTAEKFEDFTDRYDENREIVAKALTLAEGKGQGVGQSWGVIVAVITIIVAVCAVVVALLVGIAALVIVLLTK
jgi:hypothetical protein